MYFNYSEEHLLCTLYFHLFLSTRLLNNNFIYRSAVRTSYNVSQQVQAVPRRHADTVQRPLAKTASSFR